MNQIEEQALRIVSDQTLTHEQATHSLAALAGQDSAALTLTPGFSRLKEGGLICDMGEGLMPYVPRYLLPNYEKLIREGCSFLRLKPPTTLRQAILTLEIFYRHVPSITHYPVYLGNVDQLLEPFIEDMREARLLIEDFLFFLSRSIPDSYCHMNLGPKDSRAGRIILDVEAEAREAIPAITILYDPEQTPDAYAELAVTCALHCAKPSFANHKAYSLQSPYSYGIASCYNALPIAGGAFTLSRLVLSRIAVHSEDTEDFFRRALPEAANELFLFMEEKIRFLVEQSHFFTSDFLVKEEFLKLDHFTAMVGVVGLCECVNILHDKAGLEDRYGHSEKADSLGRQVMDVISGLVQNFHSKYCAITDHHFLLHAQVGIDTDIGISPGARIAIGQEPELYEHIRHAALFHPYFPSGAGDIFPFEITAKNNPIAVLDIIKGAFNAGMRYFSIYSSDSDVVRITGYLVKRSDLEKLAAGQAVLQANATWGLGAARNNRALERRIRSL